MLGAILESQKTIMKSHFGSQRPNQQSNGVSQQFYRAASDNRVTYKILLENVEEALL